MKGFLFALLILFSLDAYAQVRVRKVPFLPYLGAGGQNSAPGSSQNQGKRTIRIAFKKGSSALSPSAKAAIKRIANSCGDQCIAVITAFYSQRVSKDLAEMRRTRIADSFEDLNIPTLWGDFKFRDDSSSVVDLNQVIVTY